MTEHLERLKGGLAVITGAGSGIGEGLARYAAEIGMTVVLADIAKARIDKVVAEIKAAGGTALAVPTDASKPESLEALADAAYEAFGEVQLLINNAGIETLGFTWEIPAATWDKTLGININGVVHCVRAFAPRMIASGKPAFIANTSSVGGLGIMPVQTSYIMSKHAVLAFSECLRLEMEVKKLPIAVSAILPGPVITRIFTDSEGGADPVSRHHRGVMEAMLAANGITAQEAARRILPQIASGQFWVSTHPEITSEYAGNRAKTLLALADPQLSPDLLAMLAAE
jgi:NAD(P)-dependent dehydrogenase (short-subunit alcohol dehydrogenase family)